MCKRNLPVVQELWLCRIICVENKEFHEERIQIIYNKGRIRTKILAKKSWLQGLLENVKNCFKFQVLRNSKELRSSKAKI